MKHFKNFLIRLLTTANMPSIAAQMSYYLMLSFIPAMIFIISIASKLYLPAESILSYLELIMPRTAFEAISAAIHEVLSSNINIATLLLSLWFIMLGIRGVIIGLATSYPDTNHRHVVKLYVLSFIFAILLVIMIIASLILIVFGKHLGNLIIHFFNPNADSILFGRVLSYIIVFAILIFSFSLLFKHAPNIKLRFKDIYYGAIFTSLGWIVASMFFSFYINNFSRYGLIFGSLGGIFVFLLWLYLTTIIILIGNEINVSIYTYKHSAAYNRQNKKK